MPAGQFYPGQILDEAPEIKDNTVQFNKGITAGGVAPVVAVTAGAGTLATITAQHGYDMAGNFTLTAGTASTAAGTIVTVTFGAPWGVAPSSVTVDLTDNAGGAPLSVGPAALTSSGFTIVSAQPSANHVYLVTYAVIK